VSHLLVDIGNTALKWVFEGEGATSKGFIVLNDRWLKEFKRLVGRWNISKIYLASVKPSASKVIEKEFPNLVREITIDDLKRVMAIDYQTPHTLGVDRLLSAFGGLEFADTFLVISLGTATVVDLVLNKTFKGGSIFLGIERHLRCLYENAEKLPLVELKEKPPLVGKSTKKALLSGVFYSLKFSLEGFIREYHRRYGVKRVFFSGGYAHLFRNVLEIPFPVEVRFFDNLTLRGIKRFIETVKEPNLQPNNPNQKF